MNTSFRFRRYLVALLWSWSTPMMAGFVLGGVFIGYSNLTILQAADKAFAVAYWMN